MWKSTSTCHHRWTTASFKTQADKQIQKIETLISTSNWLRWCELRTKASPLFYETVWLQSNVDTLTLSEPISHILLTVSFCSYQKNRLANAQWPFRGTLLQEIWMALLLWRMANVTTCKQKEIEIEEMKNTESTFHAILLNNRQCIHTAFVLSCICQVRKRSWVRRRYWEILSYN